MFKRFLTLNVPTMAVIGGHCMAGGVMLALMHDKIVMQNNPKFKFVLNEVDAGIGFSVQTARIPMELLSPDVGRKLAMGQKFSP